MAATSQRQDGDDSDQEDSKNIPIIVNIINEMNLPEGCTIEQIAGKVKLRQRHSPRHSKSTDTRLEGEVRRIIRDCLYVGLVEENNGRYVLRPSEVAERGRKRHRSSVSVESHGELSNSTTTDGYITPDNEQDEPKCSGRRKRRGRKGRRESSSSEEQDEEKYPSSDDEHQEDKRPLSATIKKRGKGKKEEDFTRPLMDANNSSEENNADDAENVIPVATSRPEPDGIRRINDYIN